MQRITLKQMLARREDVSLMKKIRMTNPAMVEILDNAELSYNCVNRWL